MILLIKKVISFFSALAIFLFTHAQGNQLKDISIASPNAASLGKYGDIPVSYHTGIPSIDIPIYTAEEGPLKIPISISYHASGMKVQEQASWVGAGWSLSAGGMITRSVNGQADDRGFGSTSNVMRGHFSNYGYNNYDSFYWVGFQGNGCPSPTSDNKMIDGSPIINGSADYEPDMFNFNFLGYSGKFYFRDDRTPTLVPEQDLKIQTFTQTSADNIYGFVITTPDGTQYYFGKNQLTDGNIDALEVSSVTSASGGTSNATCISSWFLNRVISADGKFVIKLLYTAEEYSYYTISLVDLDATSPDTEKEYKLIKNNVQGVRLNQIVTSNGVISFTPGTLREDMAGYNINSFSEAANEDAKTLSSIGISNNQGFCKSFSFQYDYFIDSTSSLPNGLELPSPPTITTDKKRLRLTQIKERSCDSSIELQPYIFSYNAPSGHPTFAPRSLNFGQDHWGFYNGKVSNPKMMPTYTVDKFTVNQGADREPSWPEMSYGILNQIKYPTGGTTDFVFEPNDIWSTYLYYDQNSVATSALGPGIGQGSPSQTSTINCSGNPYKFVVDFHTSSPTTNGYGTFNGLTVDRLNPHAEVVMQPNSGTTNYYLTQNNMTGTDYVTATIYEEVPQTFADNKIVGGLRIKSITNNDGVTTTPAITNYNYEINGQSSGILYSRPTYVQIPRNDLLTTYGMPAANSSNCVSWAFFYVKKASSVRPLSTTQGNHIGYNEVKATKTGNGYSIYRYYGSDMWDADQRDLAITNVNSGNSCDPDIPNFVPAPNPFEYKRGELKYEGHYNESGQVLKESTYYPVFTENPVKTPAIVYYISSSITRKTHYELSTAKKTQMTVVTNDYSSPGNALTTIDSSFYLSPYHCMVTRNVTINSKGETIETKYKYAFDYRSPSFDTLSDCYAQYAASATAATNTRDNHAATCTNTTSCNCKNDAYVQWLRDITLARVAYISCRRSKFMDSVNTYKTNHDNAKSNADAELKPVLELQDRYQNPVIESSSWKKSQLAAAVFSRYDFTDSNIYINKTKLIHLAALSSTFTQSATASSSITKDSRYKDESVYSFSSGNPTQVIAHDGVANSYIWDYSNNQPIVKIVGATSDQVAYTSFEADGKGNWTFSGTPSVDNSAPTGHKCYLLSNGSISKSSLSTSGSYVVSYWSRSGQQTVSGSGTVVTGRIFGPWTYYEHPVANPSGGTITVSGSGTIDELRLYPKGALMSSYTYQPLIGMTSQCDPNNRISYYEYDKLGRLSIVKDQDNKIIRKICYNYAGQTENCSSGYYQNVLKSGNYTRNNCDPGYVGSSVTYTVPAGTYVSPVGQAYVDSLAQAQVYANGQSYANTNGSCNCDNTACSNLGVNHKCVYGSCDTGVKTFLSSTFDRGTGLWTCTYVYFFSDCSSSSQYTEVHTSSCSTGFCH